MKLQKYLSKNVDATIHDDNSVMWRRYVCVNKKLYLLSNMQIMQEVIHTRRFIMGLYDRLR